jgi:hypothetical protein
MRKAVTAIMIGLLAVGCKISISPLNEDATSPLKIVQGCVGVAQIVGSDQDMFPYACKRMNGKWTEVDEYSQSCEFDGYSIKPRPAWGTNNIDLVAATYFTPSELEATDLVMGCIAAYGIPTSTQTEPFPEWTWVHGTKRFQLFTTVSIPGDGTVVISAANVT